MNIQVPVTVIIYNRYEITLKLFEVLKLIKPKKMYLIADGPKIHKQDDSLKCKKTREIFNEVDWDCKLEKNFASKNMGLKDRIISGLNWVFEKEEYSIILEDDCIPSKSFFDFSAQNLIKYKNTSEVGIICGTNEFEEFQMKSDYFFARTASMWGWATWKRVWNSYDLDKMSIENTKFDLVKTKLNKIGANDLQTKSIISKIEMTLKNEMSSWIYRIGYWLLIDEKLFIVPKLNLVSNIGFGVDSTHTKSKKYRFSNQPSNELKFPIDHPKLIHINTLFEKRYLKLRSPKYSKLRIFISNFKRIITSQFIKQ